MRTSQTGISPQALASYLLSSSGPRRERVLLLAALSVLALIAFNSNFRLSFTVDGFLPYTRGTESAGGSSPKCPSFDSQEDKLNLSANLAFQHCVSVPSALNAFNISICYRLATIAPAPSCNAFAFHITRTDPKACSAAEASSDPSLDVALSDWIRRERGPDGFMIMTDGAERIVSEWSTYNGNCSYQFNIHLRNPGPVFLQVWHTYEEYRSFSETNSSWPELLLNPLMSSRLALDPCPSVCPRITAPPSSPNAVFTLLTTPTSPPCEKISSPIQGSYLPIHPLDAHHPPAEQHFHNGNTVGGHYQFVPHGCQWTHAARRFHDPSSCLNRKKKVLILGDSHGRAVYDGIVHRLNGQTSFLTHSIKTEDKRATIGQTNFRYIWDASLEGFKKDPCKYLQDLDIIIVTVGAHRAGSNEPTSVYKDFITHALSIPPSCNYSSSTSANANITKIFLTSPPQPPRQDPWVISFKDHRTNVRLQHWRDITIPIAQEKGWVVVDQFALMMPVAWAPMLTDLNHYLTTDAFDPLLDEVIGKARLCPLV